MTDVARVAGVSQSSVSLVLNRMEGARISEATRDRVLIAARDLGYQLPADRRKEFRAQEPTTIAYLVDEISTSPHAVVTLDGARDAGWEQGYLVAAHVTRSNPELEAATIAAVLRDPATVGIIYSTIFTRRVTPPPRLAEVPSVLLNCHARQSAIPAVVPGEVSGGFIATRHLTDLGHRRIGFIDGEPWMDAASDRLKGYRQALASADIPFDPVLVANGDWLPLTGYDRTKALLALAERPTAIFCANDLMAVGAIEAARELGLGVPDDLSIMGYDDQELSRYTNPPLSTVVLSNYEMGRQAIEMLIDIVVRGTARKPLTLKIDGDLVVRGSTAPIQATDRFSSRHKAEPLAMDRAVSIES